MSRLEDSVRRDERRSAWAAAKLAVRSYAHDPSDVNAGQVRRAWLKVRRATDTAIARRAGRKLDGVSRGNGIDRR